MSRPTLTVALIATVAGLALLAPAPMQGAPSGPPSSCDDIKLTASDAGSHEWFGKSVAVSGDIAVIGAPFNDPGGAAYMFARAQGGPDNWGEVKKLFASDAAEDDQFGSSVAVSGDIAVVGAFRNDDGGSSSGSAYIFARDQGGPDNWGEVRKLTASDADFGDWFGWSVAVSGDIVVVGAHRNDDAGIHSGSAYIFARDQGGPDNWGEVKKLAASDAAESDFFGLSVAASGDIVVAGAPSYFGEGLTGSAYVFARAQGGPDNWGEVKKLTAADAEPLAKFGSHVAVSGDIVVAGAPSNFGQGLTGSAYVFARDQGGADNWGEVRVLTASDGAADDRFGQQVSVSGDIAVVGAPSDDDACDEGVPCGSGSAYVFARDHGGPDNWGEVKKLTAMDAAQFDFFGDAVSVSGDIVFVGAPENDDDDAGVNSGSAYVFCSIAPPACPADLDGDGSVGTSDLLALFAQWGTAGSADFDKSGVVDTSDLLILFANWGPCP